MWKITKIQNFNALEQGFSSAKISSKVQISLNDLLQKPYHDNKIANNPIAAKQQNQQKF